MISRNYLYIVDMSPFTHLCILQGDDQFPYFYAVLYFSFYHYLYDPAAMNFCVCKVEVKGHHPLPTIRMVNRS